MTEWLNHHHLHHQPFRRRFLPELLSLCSYSPKSGGKTGRRRWGENTTASVPFIRSRAPTKHRLARTGAGVVGSGRGDPRFRYGTEIRKWPAMWALSNLSNMASKWLKISSDLIPLAPMLKKMTFQRFSQITTGNHYWKSEIFLYFCLQHI